MAATHTLVGNLFDLIATPQAPSKADVFVITNLDPGEALVDRTTKRVHLGGGKPATLTGDGTFTAKLIDTSATDLNVAANTAQYQVVIDYVDPATRASRTWRSGWFEMTSDETLADLATEASPRAVATASTYALEAKGYRDQAEALVISDLGTTDGQTRALIEAPASQTAQALSAMYARKGTNGRTDLGLGSAATADADDFDPAGSAASVQAGYDALANDVAAWTPTGVFKGTWAAGAYAQGDRVIYSGNEYAAASAAISTDVPGAAAKWVLMPSGTDLKGRSWLQSSIPGTTVTNLATIPVPYPSPAPSTGWGHGGPTAGTNSRVGTGGPSGLAPAFYRRTFSATATGVNSIYGTIEGITAGQRYAFRMNGRGSWNGRRLLQVSWRDSGGATLSTVQSEWTTVKAANSWQDLAFTPDDPAPVGAVSARVLYVVEVGGASATPGSGATIDGTALMGVLGTRITRFAVGDSPLGVWNGTAQQSTSTIHVPTTVAPKPNLWTVSPGAGAADFTTITEAVAACAEGDTVLIYPGTYEEQVPAWTRNEIHLVGVNRTTCILKSSTGQYATPPLEIGSGSVRNMTIIEDHATGGTDVDINSGDQRAYSIHPDNLPSMIGRTLLLEDLILRNTRRPVIGCGLYQGTTVTVRNCDIESGPPVLAGDRKRGAIYFHGRDTSLDGASTTDQHIVLERNRIVHTGGDQVFYLYDAGSPTYPSVMDVLCVGNYLWSEATGVADIMGGDGFTADVTLHPGSFGNNVTALNA